MSKIILSIDSPEINDVLEWVNVAKEYVVGFKIHNAIIKYGICVLKGIRELVPNHLIMADLKLNDITKTIKSQINILNPYSDIITVKANCKYSQEDNSKIAGVLNLSNVEKQNHPIYGPIALEMIDDLKYGYIVCSNLSMIRQAKRFSNMKTIAVGIRSDKTDTQDHYKPMSIEDAMIADYVVIGSEITESNTPLATMESLCKKLNK